MLLLKILGLNNEPLKNGRIMFNNYMGKGFVALRKSKKRYGRSKSKCFVQYHFGLTSIYFERKAPKKQLWWTFGH